MLFGHAQRKNDDLVRVLTGQADEPEPRPDGVVDFDGGAEREIAPAQSDPEADHGAFLAALLRQPTSGGGMW